MIILITLCLLLAIPLSFFVLSPLLSKQSKQELSRAFEGFSDESELRKVTELRDALFQKLIYDLSNKVEIQNLTEEEALKALVNLCGRLQHADLPWEPSSLKNPKQEKETGSISIGALFYLLLIGFLFFVGTQLSYAQANPDHAVVNHEKVTAPSDVTIPPPSILPKTGNWLPAVNQYILIPMQGRLHVYYVGMFSNTLEAQEAKIQIPLPKGFEDLRIFGNPNLIIEKSTSSGSPIINTPLSKGVNQLSVEFSLPAIYGEVQWLPSDLFVLPGVAIFMMPEYNGGLRNLFSNFSDSVNIWPPRIVNIPENFKSFAGEDPFDNSSAIQLKAKQVSRQLFRIGDSSSSFPTFDVKGIVPSRIPIYVLVVFFACFLFGIAVFFIFKTSK